MRDCERRVKELERGNLALLLEVARLREVLAFAVTYAESESARGLSALELVRAALGSGHPLHDALRGFIAAHKGSPLGARPAPGKKGH